MVGLSPLARRSRRDRGGALLAHRIRFPDIAAVVEGVLDHGATVRRPSWRRLRPQEGGDGPRQQPVFRLTKEVHTHDGPCVSFRHCDLCDLP